MPQVFVCNAAAGVAVHDYPYDFGDGRGFVLEVDLARVEPNCPEGQSEWVDVASLQTSTPVQPLPALNELGPAFAAGFTVMGVGLLMSMAVRFVVQAVRRT